MSSLRRPVTAMALALGLAVPGLLVQPTSTAWAAPAKKVRLRAVSKIVFDDTRNGVVKTTRKVWVPNGGQLGVYGRNTRSKSLISAFYLRFRVYRDDGKDVTNQFWRPSMTTRDYFLREGEKVNKRVVNRSGKGHHYYIRAECQLRVGHPYLRSEEHTSALQSRENLV